MNPHLDNEDDHDDGDDDYDDNANTDAPNVILLSIIVLSYITNSNVYLQDEVWDKKCVRS